MQKISDEQLNGLRWSLQEHITSIESRLRRRIRGKLQAAGWYDVDDIVASMRRRLDMRLIKGDLSVNNESQLNCLIRKVAEKVALEKYRNGRRQYRLEMYVAQREAQMAEVLDSPGDAPVSASIIMELKPYDRRLLELWLQGLTQHEIAEQLGIPLETYRKRRQRLFAVLRSKAALFTAPSLLRGPRAAPSP